MQERLIELHQQRGRLLERIAQQRQTLALQFEPLRAPLALPERLAQKFRQGQQFVLEHPYVVTTAVLAIAVFRPGFAWRWARRGLVAWRTWRTLRGLLPGAVSDLLRR